jgi:polar amino acid transport system substrate-binding protein
MAASPQSRARGSRRLAAVVGGAALAAGGLVAAGLPSGASATHGPAARVPNVSVHGVPVAEDMALAAEVPAAVKTSGFKDISYNDFAPDIYVAGGKLTGWEADLGQAVAATLGVAWHATASGAFDTFIPSLQNGRFNTSFTSFIVTPARTKVIDIVSLADVGTGFAAKRGSSVKPVKTTTDLCGDTVAVITASAFIGQLQAIDPACKKAGKPSITVQTYPSDAAAELAVSSGRAQLYGTSVDDISWLIHQTGKTFILEPINFDATPEGVGITKGIGLDKPITDAANHLIADGTYKAIMAKWGFSSTGLVAKAVDYNH